MAKKKGTMKVGRKGKIYPSSKPKITYRGKTYSNRNARIKAQRIKKQLEKNKAIMLRESQKQHRLKREKLAKQKLIKRRKDWKTQAKNRKKYEKRGHKAVSKARVRRDKSYWLVKK